jgi:D-glycero-D-manno-heptose 1,7-bisphosphate phosphatase
MDTGPGVRRAAFLDRDGTIIVERNYLRDPADVELLPGAAAGLRALRDAGYLLVLVTNQSGIARGLLDEADFHAVQRRLEELLAAEGVALDATYWCPHHPDYTGPCECRKPGTALFRRAAEELGVELAASVFVGDRMRDVEPALELGGRGVLVRTGYGEEEEEGVPEGIVVVADLERVVE